jgi:hypothetical protein
VEAWKLFSVSEMPLCEPPPPGDTDRQITLDVQVVDKSGAPVRGLEWGSILPEHGSEREKKQDKKQPSERTQVAFHYLPDF